QSEVQAAPEPLPAHAQAARPRKRPAAVLSTAPPVRPPVQPQPEAITGAPPDWHQELQIAANNQIEGAESQRRHPSVLPTHDSAAVKPGSTDTAGEHSPGITLQHIGSRTCPQAGG